MPIGVVFQGFEDLLESLDDLVLDVPNAPQLLSLFMSRAIVDDVLPPSFVLQISSGAPPPPPPPPPMYCYFFLTPALPPPPSPNTHSFRLSLTCARVLGPSAAYLSTCHVLQSTTHSSTRPLPLLQTQTRTRQR